MTDPILIELDAHDKDVSLNSDLQVEELPTIVCPTCGSEVVDADPTMADYLVEPPSRRDPSFVLETFLLCSCGQEFTVRIDAEYDPS